MFKHKLTAGFTLYEMLITLGIVTIIMGIVLYNHKQFDTDIEITNLAYRTALSVREAQVDSVSIKLIDPKRLGSDISYGIHFERNTDDAFILFADSDDNGVYTPTTPGSTMSCGGGECIEKISIGRGNKIKGFCSILVGSDAAQPCIKKSGAAYSAYGSFDIKFKRPDPDATFVWYLSNTYSGPTSSLTNICSNNGTGSPPKACTGWAICLISPQGRDKKVVVYKTGQISVENVAAGTACDGTL